MRCTPRAADDIAPMGNTLCNVLRKIGSLLLGQNMIDVSVVSPGTGGACGTGHNNRHIAHIQKRPPALSRP